MQDDLGGLQVMGADNEWIHAPPMADSYIVNLGDMIARWTNDKYRSTLHRVVNFSGKEPLFNPIFFTAAGWITRSPPCRDVWSRGKHRVIRRPPSKRICAKCTPETYL